MIPTVTACMCTLCTFGGKPLRVRAYKDFTHESTRSALAAIPGAVIA